eukprot:Pompholyxophrys_punicea_v1_NODE_367_length_2146_cov_6.753228.p3 type:complete len:135 gc:universal NODE_367_length_2146_cov_6.753228:1633-1229(-)
MSGNPFSIDSEELITIDNQTRVDQKVLQSYRNLMSLGTQQYQKYLQEVVISTRKSLNAPIKQNKLPLISTPPSKVVSTKDKQIYSLKSDLSLFSRLYISTRHRGGDLDEFFQHEKSNLASISVQQWRFTFWNEI